MMQTLPDIKRPTIDVGNGKSQPLVEFIDDRLSTIRKEVNSILDRHLQLKQQRFKSKDILEWIRNMMAACKFVLADEDIQNLIKAAEHANSQQKTQNDFRTLHENMRKQADSLERLEKDNKLSQLVLQIIPERSSLSSEQRPEGSIRSFDSQRSKFNSVLGGLKERASSVKRRLKPKKPSSASPKPAHSPSKTRPGQDKTTKVTPDGGELATHATMYAAEDATADGPGRVDEQPRGTPYHTGTLEQEYDVIIRDGKMLVIGTESEEYRDAAITRLGDVVATMSEEQRTKCAGSGLEGLISILSAAPSLPGSSPTKVIDEGTVGVIAKEILDASEEEAFQFQAPDEGSLQTSHEVLEATTKRSFRLSGQEILDTTYERTLEALDERASEDLGEEALGMTDEERSKATNNETFGVLDETMDRAPNEETPSTADEESLETLEGETLFIPGEEMPEAIGEATIGALDEGISAEKKRLEIADEGILEATNEETLQVLEERSFEVSGEETLKAANEGPIGGALDELMAKASDEDTLKTTDEETLAPTGEEISEAPPEDALQATQGEAMGVLDEEALAATDEETLRVLDDGTAAAPDKETHETTDEGTLEASVAGTRIKIDLDRPTVAFFGRTTDSETGLLLCVGRILLTEPGQTLLVQEHCQGCCQHATLRIRNINSPTEALPHKLTFQFMDHHLTSSSGGEADSPTSFISISFERCKGESLCSHTVLEGFPGGQDGCILPGVRLINICQALPDDNEWEPNTATETVTSETADELFSYQATQDDEPGSSHAAQDDDPFPSYPAQDDDQVAFMLLEAIRSRSDKPTIPLEAPLNVLVGFLKLTDKYGLREPYLTHGRSWTEALLPTIPCCLNKDALVWLWVLWRMQVGPEFKKLSGIIQQQAKCRVDEDSIEHAVELPKHIVGMWKLFISGILSNVYTRCHRAEKGFDTFPSLETRLLFDRI
ncbi:hypothetical protein ACHAPT_005374 [Fusarium lateritium]